MNRLSGIAHPPPGREATSISVIVGQSIGDVQLSRSLSVSTHSQARAPRPYTPHAMRPSPRELHSLAPSQRLYAVATEDGQMTDGETQAPLQSWFGGSHTHWSPDLLNPFEHVKLHESVARHCGVAFSGYVQVLALGAALIFIFGRA